MTQLDRIEKDFIKGKENRNLDGHGQTAAHRVDFISPIQIHHFLVDSFSVILEFLPQFRHFGLQFLHFSHRAEADLRRVPEEDFNDHRQDDDGQTIIARVGIEEFHGIEHGLGHDIEPPEIQRSVQIVAEGFQ